jgi:hypothetical protein
MPLRSRKEGGAMRLSYKKRNKFNSLGRLMHVFFLYQSSFFLVMKATMQLCCAGDGERKRPLVALCLFSSLKASVIVTGGIFSGCRIPSDGLLYKCSPFALGLFTFRRRVGMFAERE